MANLTAPELLAVRRRMEALALSNGAAVSWRKSEINAAAQALENLLESSVTAISNAIETAAPGKFTAAQKKRLFATWMRYYLAREGL